MSLERLVPLAEPIWPDPTNNFNRFFSDPCWQDVVRLIQTAAPISEWRERPKPGRSQRKGLRACGHVSQVVRLPPAAHGFEEGHHIRETSPFGLHHSQFGGQERALGI